MKADKAKIASSTQRVGAVIVSYFPDVAALARNIEALTPQIAHIVLVDNGSAPRLVSAMSALTNLGSITLISFSENHGIAAAQNAGIAHIQAMGLEYIVLFDQDSQAAPDMVEELLNAYDTHTAKGMRVAAAGALTIDARTGSVGKFAVFSHGRIVQRSCANESDVVLADTLIASGCLMPMSALKEIGMMNSDYFIDNVDTEWCIRARLNHWQLLGVPKAKLFHNLGDRTVRVWAGRWRNVFVHTPLRDYYIARNTVLMLRTLNMPFSWKVALASRLLTFIVFSLLALAPRLGRMKKLGRGLLHGFCKRGGPIT